ncbi:MAG TPA: hypothetical protein VEY33_12620 [Gemmatimonadota bacterium]|nr:hypothetical protein [Gemmatimonadota bacterium]
MFERIRRVELALDLNVLGVGGKGVELGLEHDLRGGGDVAAHRRTPESRERAGDLADDHEVLAAELHARAVRIGPEGAVELQRSDLDVQGAGGNGRLASENHRE